MEFAQKAKETAHKVVDFGRDAKKKIDLAKDKASGYIDTGLDAFESLRVDIDKVRGEPGFIEFMNRTYGDLGDVDPQVDKSLLKERYVIYSHTKKVNESLAEVYASQLKGLVDNPQALKGTIEAYVSAQAKNSPETLRRLARESARVRLSEQRIAEQEEIRAQLGGQEKLEEKLAVLQSAERRKGIIGRILGNKENELARKKASAEYGVSLQRLQQEIEKTKGDIKTVKQAENIKERIHKQFAPLRKRIYEDSVMGQVLAEEARTIIAENMERYKAAASSSGDLEKIHEINKILADRSTHEGQIRLSEKNTEELDEDLENFEMEIHQKIDEELNTLIASTPAPLLESRLLPFLKRESLGALQKGREARETIRKKLLGLAEHNPQLDGEKRYRVRLIADKYVYLTV